MEPELNNEIYNLARKAAAAEKPHEAMQLAQAALSVAQAKSILTNIENQRDG